MKSTAPQETVAIRTVVFRPPHGSFIGWRFGSTSNASECVAAEMPAHLTYKPIDYSVIVASSINIFLSSTSKDLASHREMVVATLTRIRQKFEAMEYFGALPGEPLEECLEARVRDISVERSGGL